MGLPGSQRPAAQPGCGRSAARPPAAAVSTRRQQAIKRPGCARALFGLCSLRLRRASLPPCSRCMSRVVASMPAWDARTVLAHCLSLRTRRVVARRCTGRCAGVVSLTAAPSAISRSRCHTLSRPVTRPHSICARCHTAFECASRKSHSQHPHSTRLLHPHGHHTNPCAALPQARARATARARRHPRRLRGRGAAAHAAGQQPPREPPARCRRRRGARGHIRRRGARGQARLAPRPGARPPRERL